MSSLSDIWDGLRLPASGGLSARLHPDSHDVWLALDDRRRRHLLLRVTGSDTGQVLMSTNGLRASVDWLSVEGEPSDAWADIVCLEPALNDTFDVVANDLASEAREADSLPLEAVRRTLRTWQWFWSVDASGLSNEAALGLFGELWFMSRWAVFPDVIDVWTGPAGTRHDFVSRAVSVEVKTSRVRGDGPLRHRVANLDQLDDPETGHLLLFSLAVAEDVNAANTLPALISHLRGRVRERPELLAALDRGLAHAGWTPAASIRHGHRWRILSEELYRVDHGFPRLTRGSFPHGLPVGVDMVTYTVDLAACAPFRTATAREEAAIDLSELKP
jgi:hypothetical protein